MKQHELFADWYRKVDPSPDADTLEKRWTVISNIIQQAEPTDWITYARIYVGAVVSKEELEQFAGMFKKRDATFPMRENSRELQVLAGSAIATVVGKEKSKAVIPALILMSATCQGKGSDGPLSDVFTSCRDYLLEYGREIRSGMELYPFGDNVSSRRMKVPEGLKPSYKTANKQKHWSRVDSNFEETESAFSQVEKAIETVVTSFKKSITEMDGTVEIVAKRTDARLRVLEEENNILWWIYSEASRGTEEPLSSLEKGSAIVVGKELADLVVDIPGPPATRAFLNRALRNAGLNPNEEFAIDDVVEEVPMEWREDVVDTYSVPDEMKGVVTVATAVEQSVMMPAEADWTKALSDVPITVTTQLSLIDWAEQAYVEFALLRTVSNLEAE